MTIDNFYDDICLTDKSVVFDYENNGFKTVIVSEGTNSDREDSGLLLYLDNEQTIFVPADSLITSYNPDGDCIEYNLALSNGGTLAVCIGKDDE